MKESEKSTVNFFSYVRGDDEEIMESIFGRKNIHHEKAILHGYELCIQTAKNVIDTILPTCKLDKSPRQILTGKRGQHFELFTIRPNPSKSIQGDIWYVTKDEYEHLRDYELIDCGMSEDIITKAVTENGETLKVSTHGLVSDLDNITKVVDEDYKRPEIPKEEKMKTARSLRE